MTSPLSKTSGQQRIVGFDFARAFAIWGMVLVNFKIVMLGPDGDPSIWSRLVGLLEGRAAATFVVLAGVGISLMSRRAFAAPNPALQKSVRVNLIKRALFLFVVGLAYTPIWPADILHFYGVYMLIAVCLLGFSDRKLLRIAGTVPFLFVILLLMFDYEHGWNWADLSYTGLWTWQGMLRHLFFNGFHPVIPWVAFVCAGMWLGRQNLRHRQTRRKIMGVSLVVAIVTEACAWILRLTAFQLDPNLDAETVNALLGTAPMPPMPWYLFSAGGLAIAFICACVGFTETYAKPPITALIHTGQLALTHYVAHVLVGMGSLEALGLLNNSHGGAAVLAGTLFFSAALLFSVVWRRFFKRGPLEGLMRKVTG